MAASTNGICFRGILAAPMLCGILMIFLGACNPVKQQFSDGGANQPDNQPSNAGPRASARFVLPDNLVSRAISADFDRDGRQESLVLAVNAEVDDRGRIAWDDGHRWYLYVETDGMVEGIAEFSVQLGMLELYYNRDMRQIFLRENGPYQQQVYQLYPERNYALEKVDNLPATEDLQQLRFE